MRVWILAGILALLAGAHALAAPSESALAEIRSMPWQPATNLSLPTSHSVITNLPGYLAVIGRDAQRIREIEDATSNPNIEAEVVDPQTDAEALFEYFASGYVASTDWNDVNPSQLLDQIRQNTELANRNRRSQGVPELHVTGWLQKPQLNRDTHTVSWIIKASSSGGGDIVNAIALKLGRYGYEKITLIDSADRGDAALQNLLFVANAHQFAPGARYSDYVAGTDRSAAYGVAGLVAGVLGVKLLKVAAAGGILLFFKKIAWIVLLPIIWLWRWMRSYKRSRNSAASGGSPSRTEPQLLASPDTAVPDSSRDIT